MGVARIEEARNPIMKMKDLARLLEDSTLLTNS